MYKFAAHSAYNRGVRQSATPVLPLGELPHFGEVLENLYETLKFSHEYDDFGNEIEGEDRLFADDIDWEGQYAKEAANITDKLMKTPFVMQDNPQWPNETKKALNAHIVTGISVNLPDMTSNKDVLVLCAGDGEDVTRLLHNSPGTIKSMDLLGVTSLNLRAQYAAQIFSGKMRATTRNLHELGDFKLREQYDLIVCHHGLHHVLSTREGEAAFVNVLDRLAPNGVLIGDKIDMMGLDTLEKHSNLPAHGVELIHMQRDLGIEGMMWVRVLGKTWSDPVLTDRRLLNLVPSGFSVQLLQGRGAFDLDNSGRWGRTLNGRFFSPPKSVRAACRRPEVRVMTYVEIRRGLKLPVVPNSDQSLLPFGHWVDFVPKTDAQYTALQFVINRGKHFQARDISYMGDGYSMYARKGDGIRARVAVMEDAIIMLVDTVPPKYMKYKCTKERPGGSILRLQCEYYPSENVVELNDPIALGPETPVAFLSRLNQYDAYVRLSPWIAGAIKRKQWYTTLRECVEKEGGDEFVVMPVSAPTPLMRSVEFEMTARFVKRRPTVDLMIGGQIMEVYVDNNEIKRPRPDKVLPNSAQNRREVENSVRLGELLAIETVEYDPVLEAQGLKEIKWNGDLKPTPGVVVALRYPNRHNLDPDADRAKMKLLLVVGYSPPRRYNYTTPSDHVPYTDIDGWGYDFGLDGGANKKGDGPKPIRYHNRLDEFDPETAFVDRPEFADNKFPQVVHRGEWFYMYFPVAYGGIGGTRLCGKHKCGARYVWQGNCGDSQLYVYGDDGPGIRACIVLASLKRAPRSRVLSA